MPHAGWTNKYIKKRQSSIRMRRLLIKVLADRCIDSSSPAHQKQLLSQHARGRHCHWRSTLVHFGMVDKKAPSKDNDTIHSVFRMLKCRDVGKLKVAKRQLDHQAKPS